MQATFEVWQEKEDRFLLETYKKFPLALARGEGVHVESVDGRRFLDFYGGHAVTIAGHCHPHLVAAVTEQVRQLIFYSNLCYLPVRAEAAEKLLGLLYPSMERVFLVSSGAEATEAALKLARSHTGRERIASMQQSFHGRTVAALSVTGMEKYRHAFIPNLAGSTDFVRFGDLPALEQLNPATIAAVILEPIQSMAGAVTANAAFFRGLRRFTQEHGIMLIFDEIQTGLGRTGVPFAGMHWDVEPDIVTMAKGLGGGFPAGAVAVTGAIAEKVAVGDHGTTFGGGPVACAAVKATLEIIESENLVERARTVGAYLAEKLRAVRGIGTVRGLGLLLGFTMDRPAREIQTRCFEQGILVGTSVDPQVVRLLPPLTIGEEHVDVLVNVLQDL
jgi:predicted acetylornithine/succinylornithine family transaminase